MIWSSLGEWEGLNDGFFYEIGNDRFLFLHGKTKSTKSQLEEICGGEMWMRNLNSGPYQ